MAQRESVHTTENTKGALRLPEETETEADITSEQTHQLWHDTLTDVRAEGSKQATQREGFSQPDLKKRKRKKKDNNTNNNKVQAEQPGAEAGTADANEAKLPVEKKQKVAAAANANAKGGDDSQSGNGGGHEPLQCSAL